MSWAVGAFCGGVRMNLSSRDCVEEAWGLSLPMVMLPGQASNRRVSSNHTNHVLEAPTLGYPLHDNPAMGPATIGRLDMRPDVT